MSAKGTVKDSLQKVAAMLQSVRKEAGEEPNNTSFMETAAATPAKQSEDAPTNSNPEASAVNKEKTTEAEDAGGNIGSVADNKDSDTKPAQTPDATTESPEQLNADEAVTGGGQMGTINHQDTSMDQKVASLNRGVTLVADYLSNYVSKEASASPKSDTTPAAADKSEDALLQEIEKIASVQANNYKQALVSGILLRLQDHLHIKEAMDSGAIDASKAKEIEDLGGIDGFLDKVAMENPEAILPPEIQASSEGSGEACACGAPECPGCDAGAPAAPEGLAPELPPEGDMAPEGLELPAEGGLDLGGGGEAGMGELSPEDMAAIEQVLAEAGVTEEELAASLGDVQGLAESGASPEEAAQAADMLLQEQIGEPGAEKIASDNARVQACYDFLKEARDSRIAANQE